MAARTLDCWADWLVRTRFAGLSEEERRELAGFLERTRDRVLDRARLRPDDVLVDVGTGTGLLALGALERLGEDGEVVAVDVSVDCLEELRRLCRDPRVWYHVGSADVLPLLDESVDVVVTRSVLIYVREKAEAAREFFRVLRPGGRVSLFEPINSRNQRLTEVVDFGALQHRMEDYERSLYDRDDPMLDFDERDLERFFGEAGFLELDAELDPGEQTIPVERCLTYVGAPGRASLLDEWREEFAPEEVEQLVVTLCRHEAVTLRFSGLFLAGVKL